MKFGCAVFFPFIFFRSPLWPLRPEVVALEGKEDIAFLPHFDLIIFVSTGSESEVPFFLLLFFHGPPSTLI